MAATLTWDRSGWFVMRMPTGRTPQRITSPSLEIRLGRLPVRPAADMLPCEPLRLHIGRVEDNVYVARALLASGVVSLRGSRREVVAQLRWLYRIGEFHVSCPRSRAHAEEDEEIGGARELCSLVHATAG